MVEVEVVGTAALDAAALVALPHLAHHLCRNHPRVLQVGVGGLERMHTARNLEPELEYRAPVVLLLPRVDEPEETVVNPDAASDLFIDANERRNTTRLGAARGLGELAVLG